MKVPEGANVKVILFHMTRTSNKDSIYDCGFFFLTCDVKVLFIPIIDSYAKLIKYS